MQMHAELRHVEAFLAVARLSSFTRAAAKLYLTQPAITQQMRALETELGFPLFERRGRRLRLTPAGKALQAYPPRVLALVERFVRSLEDYADRVERERTELSG